MLCHRATLIYIFSIHFLSTCSHSSSCLVVTKTLLHTYSAFRELIFIFVFVFFILLLLPSVHFLTIHSYSHSHSNWTMYKCFMCMMRARSCCTKLTITHYYHECDRLIAIEHITHAINKWTHNHSFRSSYRVNLIYVCLL